MHELVTITQKGLYCAAGGFYIDPWGAVPRAVITHAHADHARSGADAYLCSDECKHVLRARLGPKTVVESQPYGEKLRIGGVVVSFHPAGHVLGSSQVRIESSGDGGNVGRPVGGGVWVVTGDYSYDTRDVAHNTTCTPFEPVPCDTFLTESTFGLPVYHWPDDRQTEREINAWWQRNAEQGRTSVLFAYALGKAQRLLSLLDASIGPIGVHGSVHKLNMAYSASGVELPAVVHANAQTRDLLRGGGVIVAPPSTDDSAWLRKFDGKNGRETAFASGWMAVRGRRRWRAYGRGFVISDHADWNGLLDAVTGSGASRVGVTHGYAEELARYLAETRSLETLVVPTRFVGEDDSLGGSDDASAADESSDAGGSERGVL